MFVWLFPKRKRKHLVEIVKKVKTIYRLWETIKWAKENVHYVIDGIMYVDLHFACGSYLDFEIPTHKCTYVYNKLWKKTNKLSNPSTDLVKLYSKLLNDSQTEQKPNIPLATQTISIPNTVV